MDVLMTIEGCETLDQLIRVRGEDHTSLSRMIGRNPAYIQQFIKRGTPKRLDEADRAKLARYFGVHEGLLGTPRRSPTPAKEGSAPARPGIRWNRCNRASENEVRCDGV